MCRLGLVLLGTTIGIDSCVIDPKDYPVESSSRSAAGGGESGSAGSAGDLAEAGGTDGGTANSGFGGTLFPGGGPPVIGGEGGIDDAGGDSGAGRGSAGVPSGGADTGTMAPSCVGLAAECGATGNEDCCSSTLVTGGDFTLGGVSGSVTASIATFALDKYEVTAGRFQRFVGAHAWPPATGAGAHPLIAGSAWQEIWNSGLAADLASDVLCTGQQQGWNTFGVGERLPMNCMTWYEAFAFCAWDGGWLPTEAEWEYAAAGGPNQYRFPWGDSVVPDDAQDSTAVYANYDGLGDGSAPEVLAFADILPVGSRPPGIGAFGQMDLAGSMWEWTLDWEGSGYATTPGASPGSRCINCANLTPATNHVIRGGSWNFAALYMTSTFRNGYNDRGYDIGFRCARKP